MWRMTIGAVVLSAVAACVAQPADVIEASDDDHSGTFRARIGESCDAASTPFCDTGGGWCHGGVCRPWCGLFVEYEPKKDRCAGDEGAVIAPSNKPHETVCVCVPRTTRRPD